MNHLYAVASAAGKLYVFTVTTTSVKQAPGSPYAITSPGYVAGVPNELVGCGYFCPTRQRSIVLKGRGLKPRPFEALVILRERSHARSGRLPTKSLP